MDCNCSLDHIANIIKNYYLIKYEFCSFSGTYESYKLSNDGYLIEKTKETHEPIMLYDKNGFDENDDTNENGKHCWRMYVQHVIDTTFDTKWFLFGVSKFGVKINGYSFCHPSTSGISGNGNKGDVHCTNYSQYHRSKWKYRTR